MSEQVSMSIDARFGFEALKQIIDICIFQWLTSSGTSELNEEVIGFHFISMYDDQVIENLID
jgi:hypothetical protein